MSAGEGLTENGSRIRVTEDGPYKVDGSPPLGRTAQVETEYGEPIGWAPLEPIDAPATFDLCRCGHSARKPFCDSSHESASFDGTEVADRAARRERAEVYLGDGVVMTDDHTLCEHAGHCGDRFTNVWREPSIGVIRDGPLWVRGGIPIESSDGTTYEVLNRVTLCRCGRSSNKPFCDGTHKEVEFRDG